jgi:hypothetical protein
LSQYGEGPLLLIAERLTGTSFSKRERSVPVTTNEIALFDRGVQRRFAKVDGQIDL